MLRDSHKESPAQGRAFSFLVAGAGLTRIASGRFSPLRGALRASKTLARFVEQGSPPDPTPPKMKKGPARGPFIHFGSGA